MAQQLPGEAAGAEEYWWHIRLRQSGLSEGHLSAHTMTASEQMFFLGAPLAHVLTYEEHLKAMRRRPSQMRAGRLSRLIKCSAERFSAPVPVTLPELLENARAA